jgi:two-component system response regulator YesN
MEFNKMLIEALERLDESQVKEAFTYLETSLKNKESTTGHEVIQMAKEAMNLYLFHLRHNKFVIRDSDVFFDTFSLNIENCGSMEEVFASLTGTIIKSFNQVIAESNKKIINRSVRRSNLSEITIRSRYRWK